jgi:hypothetical protein
MGETTTHSVGTEDWKAITESLGLVVRDPATMSLGLFTWVSASNQEKTDANEEPLFGSHLREAATTVKKLLGS